jgi:DNA-binding response OmpR family regulator
MNAVLTALDRRTATPLPAAAVRGSRLVALVPLEEVAEGTTVLGTLSLAEAVGPPEGPSDDSDPVASVSVDTTSRTAWAGRQELDLTRLEFELLALLVRTPRVVFTREQLLSIVWEGYADGLVRTVDVHVHRLRRKLGTPYDLHLATVRGVGYRWDPAPRPHIALTSPRHGKARP